MFQRCSLASLALLGLSACGLFPSGGAPLEGRWYGTVIIDSKLLKVDHSNFGGAIHDTSNLVEISTGIGVDEAGLRLTRADAAQHFNQTDDLTVACMYATSRTEGSGEDSKTAASAYFSLLDDGAGGFKFGEAMPSVVMGTAHTTNHVTYPCAGINQESENETPGMWGSSPPMVGGKLSPDGKSAVGSQIVPVTFDDTSYEIHWSLKRDKEIVAKAGGPYTVERGQRVKLDASQSRGDITDYIWTLTPTDKCKTGSPLFTTPLSIGTTVTPHGQTFEFVALCKVNVHLEVTGPAGEDDDDAVLAVTPRIFRTTPVKEIVTPAVLVEGLAGTNRCAVEKAKTGHFLHKDDMSTWNSSGYTLKEITQPDSPFAGAFYVDTTRLKVTREEVINDLWKPGGSVNNQNPGALQSLFIPQIQAHEHAHTTLLFQWLKRHAGRLDPAQRIEGMLGMSATLVMQSADVSLDEDDRGLCMATQHSYVWPIVKAANPAFTTGRVTILVGADMETVDELYMLGNDDPCP